MECDNEKCRSPHESTSDLDKKIIFLQNYIRKVQDKCIVITNNDLLIKHNLEIAAATINLNFLLISLNRTVWIMIFLRKL